MRNEGLSFKDGLMMRQLLDFPGGLELHIGVSEHGTGQEMYGGDVGVSIGLATMCRVVEWG